MPKPSRKKAGGRRGTRPSQRRTSVKASKEKPVTLSEAKALAGLPTQHAKRRRKRVGSLKGLGTEARLAVSLIKVGRERQKLHELYEREHEERIRRYTAIMKIMKSRGVKGLGAASGRRVRGKTTVALPLQILAEGDSWFDYPVPNFGGGIIPRLKKLIGVPILNLAKAGDQVRRMMDVEGRQDLVKRLREGCPAGGPWDVLLFSGGGNDVVDNHLELCVKEFDPAIPVVNHIDQPRYDAVLALLRAGYEDLIALRNTFSPTTHLVLHAYDFAIPDGRGVCWYGPWLEPTFNLRNFPRLPRLQEKIEVVKAMLKQFAALLQSLVRPGVTFINAQGTLSPQSSSWHNEMHPEKAGFDSFARMFHQHLKATFPGRVL